MTDNQSWAHTDVYLLTIELVLYQLLSLFRDRLQTFDEERGDTRNQLHNGTHGNTEEENLLDIELCSPTNQSTYDNSQYQWFAQYTKLLLQAFGIDVELRETWNKVEEFVEAYSERSEALAERLWNRNTIKVVVFLELLCCEVGKHQSDDVADDSCEITPCKALVHYKVGNSTNKCKVPIVPEVDVDSTCCLSQQHQ